MTEKQRDFIEDMQSFTIVPPKEDFTGTTKGEASDYISKWIDKVEWMPSSWALEHGYL